MKSIFVHARAALITGLISLAQLSAADFYIGDAASQGTAVTTGSSSYSISNLTIAMHDSSPVVYTASSNQDLLITEVNFFSDEAGSVRPFIAIFDGTNLKNGSAYEILAIGDTITASANLLHNSAFKVGTSNPTVSVSAGDKIIAGYMQSGGRVISLNTVTSGTNDYIHSGDSLTGQSAGDPLDGNSDFNLDRSLKFNIGFEITNSGPDSADPLLISLNPADDTTDASVDSNLTAIFNEAITIGSGDITIKNLDTLSQMTIPIGDVQVSVAGTTLTINPSSDLNPNTNYAVHIAPEAIDDLADNSYAGISNDLIWSFTTASTPLIATSPVTRQVVQRDRSNLGTIPITGTVGNSVDSIEARAVAPADYDKNLGAIWFIGDSITQSNADSDSNGSPRKSLYDLLVADSATFSFTGHNTRNIDGLPASGSAAATNLYHYHSGISGSVIGAAGGRTNMTAGIPGWWNSGRLTSTKPNIVLIMLGTNDIDINADATNAPARMKLLVNTILAQVGAGDPNPAIFVAQITPNTGSAAEAQRVIDFNNALPAVIATLQGEGKDVTLVDQFSLINANTEGLMRDTLHTNTAGNNVLASQWFNAIKTRFATTSGATTTPWQTIVTNPVGTFTGNLANVKAGGWYSVEVRSIISESPVETITIDKVGVGDIYVTAGQSNSANHGSPTLTPLDERVVARSSARANTWVHAADPMPIASGNRGSVWSRLGDLLVEAENIPIGFVAVGVGSTQVNDWIPGSSHYNNRLKPALESFPINGFRAILWHQGESDSLASVTASTHASRLNSMISQSRTDAGWSIPWYISEASFLPRSNLQQEERVTAGQRSTVHGDPLIFLGPSTDELHLEDAAGGKLRDAVHFNTAGLLDHATQWRDILRGTTTITPRNSGFEDNHTVAITNLSPLVDGAVQIATTSVNDSPMVLDWRILAASGIDAADGSNGIHNPTTGTYADAVNTNNGGVLPNMDGLHVALLDGGTAGNYFLQSTRVAAKTNTNYTLTVAIGVRDNPASFGNARLEITSNGSVVASTSFNKTSLDTLSGGDVSGKFTDASVSWTTNNSVSPNQPLAIRVVKEGGASTVLDFDNVRFEITATSFNDYIIGFNTGGQNTIGDDPDGDGIKNGLEAWFGTDPSTFNEGLTAISTNGNVTTLSHQQNENPPSDLTANYQWSPNMNDWYDSGAGPTNGPSITIDPVTTGSTTTVTATSSASQEKSFFRVVVTQN